MLFIILSQACSDYLDLAGMQGRRWQKMLQYEHEQRLRLEELVEQLGRQHSNLEKQVRKSMSNILNHGGQNSSSMLCNVM